MVAEESKGPVRFHFTEAPGPYAVGLKVIEQYDYSRVYRSAVDALGFTYRGERARPLQTLLWYPANDRNGTPMAVVDYVNLLATETSFGMPKMSGLALEWQAGMSGALQTRLWAVRDAQEMTQRFPVVVYAPGGSGPAWENADLCEYLASHGYLVLASPSLGPTSRRMTIDLEGIDAQARDISFLVGFAQTLRNADISNIAVVGFSWGGLSNVFAAARDSRITSLVALDGSVRFSPGLVSSGGLSPARMTIPLLSIAQGQWSPEEKARILEMHPGHDGPDVLNAWIHGDLVTVLMLGLTHNEHSSMAQRREDLMRLVFEMCKARKVDYGREDGMTSYAWLARYVLEFLNAYMKHDAISMAFLRKTPIENGAPRRFLTVEYRAANPAPASLESFRIAINRQGFDRVAEIYAQFEEHNRSFELEEPIIARWSEELIEQNHLSEAIALLKLNVQRNPGSGAVYLSLGNAYERAGQPALAAESYRCGLDKKPAWVAEQCASKLKLQS